MDVIEILRDFGFPVTVSLILLLAFLAITKTHLELIRNLQKTTERQSQTLAEIASTQGEIVALLREKQPCTQLPSETEQ